MIVGSEGLFDITEEETIVIASIQDVDTFLVAETWENAVIKSLDRKGGDRGS